MRVKTTGGKSCILFHFYIKPQLSMSLFSPPFVVSYSISTSNHNTMTKALYVRCVVSYSISTSNHNISVAAFERSIVVSYSISTSNHNIEKRELLDTYVVSYSISTSNHNDRGIQSRSELLYLIPFLHQTTTCFYAIRYIFGCILFHFYIKPQPRVAGFRKPSVVSYSISTSNHNFCTIPICLFLLYLIPFLHQTTTFGIYNKGD